MNRAALIAAVIYCLTASGIAIHGALQPPTNWMPHIFTFFATAPVAVPLSMMGHEPDFNNPVAAIGLILAVSAMVYGLVALGAALLSR